MNEAILTAGNTKKYDIPLSHLDHSYIEKCSDVKELEKILRILRSGDEGCYPDIERLAENRISEMAPNSRVLRKQEPASRLKDLDSSVRTSLQDDISKWNLEMRNREEGLTSGSGVMPDDPDLPPIRSGVISSESKKTNVDEKKNKVVKPRDYREWDKYNVDKELEKMEEKEAERQERKGGDSVQNGVIDLEDQISTKGLSEEEKLLKANREKDKGNEAFRSGDYEESVLYYSRSLSLLPTTASYNNRALAYLKKEDWDKSLQDLKQVLTAEPDNIKGLLRRGTAYKGKKDFTRAAKDFQKVLELEPTNKRAEDLLNEVKAEVTTVEKEKQERKVKGRRMMIEEVEGSEEEEEETSEVKVNGHSEICEHSIAKDTVEGVEKTPVLNGKTEKVKDIWKDEDVQTKEKSDKETNSQSDSAIKETSKVTSNGVDNLGRKEERGVNSINETPGNTEKEESKHQQPVFHVTPLSPEVTELRQAGNTLFKAGQYADALVKYQDAINILDQKGEGNEFSLSQLYSNQAACKLKTGDCSSAIADCTMALDLVPHSIKPLLRRAAAFEMKEKYRKAYVDYKHVLSVDSNVHQAHQGASRCQNHLKDLEGPKWRDNLPAMTTVFPWEIPIIVDPSASNSQPQPQTQTCTKPSVTTSSDLKSSVSSSESRVSESNSRSEPSKVSEPAKKPVPETPQQKFDRCKAAGNEHVKQSRFRQAAECYTECIVAQPEMTVAYTNRALCYLRLNKPTEAVSDCNEALKREEDNTKALYRRAQAKKMLEEYKESLGDLLHLLKVEPNNAAAKKEAEVVKQYYKKELERAKKDQAKDAAPQKQRRKMKIEEVEEDEDDASLKGKSANSSHQSKTSAKQAPTSPAQTTTATPQSPTQTTTPQSPTQTKTTPTSKKSRKSKSKMKATSGTGLPTASPSVPKLEKATPYEFLQAWNSLKTSKIVDPFTELVLQVQPEDLPKLISNKLDGQMLHKMIGCSKQIVARGEPERCYSVLSSLMKVERFSMVQMFMSAEERKDINHLCDTMTRHKTTAYTEQDVAKLKKVYGA